MENHATDDTERMAQQVEYFLNRFDGIADTVILSLTLTQYYEGEQLHRLTLIMTTYDGEDDFRGARIKATFSGIFDFRLAFGPNEAPLVLGMGVSHARSAEGHYFDLCYCDRDSVEEIRDSPRYVGFRELTFEILESNIWDK